MAVAVGQTVGAGWASGTSIATGSWTPDGPVLLLIVSRASSNTVSSVTGNGLTWGAIATVPDTQSQHRVSIWEGLGTPSAGALTVNFSGTLESGYVVAAAFTGTDADPFEATAYAEAGAVDNNDPKVSVTPLTNAAMVVGALGVRSAGTGVYTLQGAETTISINNASGAGGTEVKASMFHAGVIDPAASTQVGADNSLSTAREWVIHAVAVKPSGGAPPSGPPAGTLALLGAGA